MFILIRHLEKCTGVIETAVIKQKTPIECHLLLAMVHGYQNVSPPFELAWIEHWLHMVHGYQIVSTTHTPLASLNRAVVTLGSRLSNCVHRPLS